MTPAAKLRELDAVLVSTLADVAVVLDGGPDAPQLEDVVADLDRKIGELAALSALLQASAGPDHRRAGGVPTAKDVLGRLAWVAAERAKGKGS